MFAESSPVAYEASRQLTAAADQWRQVIAQAPQFHAGWRSLVTLLLLRGDRRSAADLVTRFAQQFPQRHLLRSRLHETQQEFTQARVELEQALALEPDNEEFHQENSRQLCHHAQPAEALPALNALLGIAPENPATWHNLGVTHVRLDQLAEAATAFTRSLVFRPDYSDTQRQLADCRQRLNNAPQLSS